MEYSSFWARLYDVPLPCMNERWIRIFAKQIGILESVDKSGEDSIGMFMRFKISVKITRPLLRGIAFQVKGEHLWLPLKYESLPVYCFSCGTIGHDHYSCQSFDPNLEYSSCIVEQQPILPHDIIENILSRVPVKYLLRFKAVCKQWKATISDPSFAEIHLQRYKISTSRYPLAWGEFPFHQYSGIYVAQFLYPDPNINQSHYQFVSAIKHSCECKTLYDIMCNVDGLYLYRMRYDTIEEQEKLCVLWNSLKCRAYKEKDSRSYEEKVYRKMYVLWNPSGRAYKHFKCPFSTDDNDVMGCLGIYYNPLMKDYEVVIADEELNHYAVFSCRHNKLSEVKEMNDGLHEEKIMHRYGCSCSNGYCYWLSYRLEEDYICNFSIVCFDSKVETFKRLPTPYSISMQSLDDFSLAIFGGRLFMFVLDHMGHVRIMSRSTEGDGEDSWCDIKVEFPFFDICWYWPPEKISENEVILNSRSVKEYVVYDASKNSFEYVPRPSEKKTTRVPLPYLENLFLQ